MDVWVDKLAQILDLRRKYIKYMLDFLLFQVYNALHNPYIFLCRL